MSQWKLAKDAPRDGTQILGMKLRTGPVKTFMEVHTIEWLPDYGFCLLGCDQYEDAIPWQPTYWMHVPEFYDEPMKENT